MDFFDRRELMQRRFEGEGNTDPLWAELGIELEQPSLGEELQVEDEEESPTAYTLRYVKTGLPVLCSVCGKNGKWQPEGDLYPIFTCDHGVLDGLPIRKIGSVSASKVITEDGASLVTQ